MPEGAGGAGDAPPPPPPSPRRALVPDARTVALYQETILEHHRRPRNRGELPGAHASAAVRNPLCGDEVTMAVAFDGDVVRDARFTGRGCSISTAAASLLTEAVRGHTREEALALLGDYAAMLGDASGAAGATIGGDLVALRAVARYRARVPCGLLPATALGRALGGATRA